MVEPIADVVTAAPIRAATGVYAPAVATAAITAKIAFGLIIAFHIRIIILKGVAQAVAVSILVLNVVRLLYEQINRAT